MSSRRSSTQDHETETLAEAGVHAVLGASDCLGALL